MTKDEYDIFNELLIYLYNIYNICSQIYGKNLDDVVANVLDCNLNPSSYLQLILFWTIVGQLIRSSTCNIELSEEILQTFSCECPLMHLWNFSAIVGESRGLEVNVLDCKNVINEFKLQSHYYVHFRIKRYEPAHPTSYG